MGICKCGHDELEHDMLDPESDEHFCFHKDCPCENFDEEAEE